MSSEESLPYQIMLHCLLVNDFLKTIEKSLITDGQDIEGFVDHYSDLIKMTANINWQIHEAAELISKAEGKTNNRL